MEQKLVTFEVAKALKEAGYPQGEVHITEIGWYNKAGVFTKELPFLWKGDDAFVALAPTYIDAWLWLWNTKNIQIEVADKSYFAKAKVMGKFFVETNPEEAIAKAIEYLVTNNLIK